MRVRDHSYPGVQLALSNVTEDRLYHRNFGASFLKLLTIPILTIGQL